MTTTTFQAVQVAVPHGASQTTVPALGGRVQLKNTGTVALLCGGANLADATNGYPLAVGDVITYVDTHPDTLMDSSPQLLVSTGTTDGQVTLVTLGAG